MLPSWFLWLQVVTCLMAAVALAWNGHWWFSLTWASYSLANIGWVFGVK